MPMFPGERPMTPVERTDDFFVDNALPGVEDQTGHLLDSVRFSIVRMNVGDGYDYVVVRPYIERVEGGLGRRSRVMTSEADPDHWWVFDADVDESEGWISQATFTPAGFIDYGGPNGDGEDGGPLGGRPDRMTPRDGGGSGGTQDWLAGPRAGGPSWWRDGGSPPPPEDDGELNFDDRRTPPPSPRDPDAPVRMNIDLDDQETAEKEGLGAWEEHEHYGVLVTENGFAVVHDGGGSPHGIVRYPDKTACQVTGGNVAEARQQAEKFLAKRPYTTAYERVLGEPEWDAAEPAAPEDLEPAPAIVRPPPAKRVWSTVPIESGDEDD